MPPLEAWLFVAVGCWIAFAAVKFAATQPPAFYNVGAVAIVLAVGWCFVSVADLQGRVGDSALLLFIASGALGAWRGTVRSAEATSDGGTYGERGGPLTWRAMFGGWRVIAVLALFLVIMAAFWWGIFSMMPDRGTSVPRRTRPPTPQTSSPSP